MRHAGRLTLSAPSSWVPIRELAERLHANLPGVVHHDIDRPEGVDCGGDDGRPALDGRDGVVVGHGFAAGCDDLRDHVVGRVRRRCLT